MAYNYPFKNAEDRLILQVWNKGGIIPDKDGSHWDPAVWRYDRAGNPMRFADHGNTASAYGWEIDHIKPKAKGGSDDLSNLQPLQWENNRRKGDDYP